MNIRLGNNKRKHLLVLAALLALATIVLARSLTRTQALEQRPAVSDRSGFTLSSDERAPGMVRKHARDIFEGLQVGAASSAGQARQAASKPAAPPSKVELLEARVRQELAGYELIGIMFMNGQRHAFLQHGERKFTVSEGEQAGNVVVAKINESSVLLRSTLAPLERELKQAR